MKLSEIKAAVLSKKTVHWTNPLYVVVHSKKTNEFLIKCTDNDSCIGLTWKDGLTMNGKEEEFYLS